VTSIDPYGTHLRRPWAAHRFHYKLNIRCGRREKNVGTPQIITPISSIDHSENHSSNSLPLRSLDCALLFRPQQSYVQVCAQQETLFLLVHHLLNGL
jgi:hypothetical protein